MRTWMCKGARPVIDQLGRCLRQSGRPAATTAAPTGRRRALEREEFDPERFQSPDRNRFASTHDKALRSGDCALVQRSGNAQAEIIEYVPIEVVFDFHQFV